MTEEREREMEKRFEDGVLEMTSTSPPSVGASAFNKANSRAHPGAALLSPQVRATTGTPSILLSPQPFAHSNASASGLLSPSGSTRYAFDSEVPAIAAPRPMSPIIDTSFSGFNSSNNVNNTSSQRPLSAQDFNTFEQNGFDPFRPFSAQPQPSQLDQQLSLNLPERPLSSMEIDSLTFKNDVGNLVNWLDTLNSNQQRSVVDNLLSNLTDDIFSYARTRVEELSYQKKQQQQQQQQQQQHQHQQQHQNNFSHQIVAPQPLYQSTMQEPVTLDSILNGSPQPWSPPPHVSHLQRALSPNFSNSMDRSMALVHEASMLNRPRSADPYSKTPSKIRGFQSYHSNFNQEGNGSYAQLQGQGHSQTGSSGSTQGKQRAFDITNLAQQLTAQQVGGTGSTTGNGSVNGSGNANGNGNGIDYGNVNSLKLSALSTINSRVQLDSGKNRKHNDDHRGRNVMNDDYMRTSSVPPPQRVNYYESIHSKELGKTASLNAAAKALTLDDNTLTPVISPQSPSGNNNNQQLPKSPAINPKQITNPKLLADIPSWLKTLRLHKYTPCLQDTPWKELIYFDEEELLQKGVTAMGARGKLLKAFEVVRQYYEDGLIE